MNSNTYYENGIGLKLPLTTSGTNFFELNYLTIDFVKDNLRNLLLTRKGERIMNPTFGCGLLNMLFETNDSILNDNIKEEINNSIEEFMPYVTITEFDIETSENSLKIIMNFSINDNINDVLTLEF